LGNVIINDDIESELKHFFKENTFTKIGVLVDENARQHCLPIVENTLPPNYSLIEIKSGEEQKNLDTCAFIWNKLTGLAFDRKSLLINLGGGVIGDMGGFCAATYKRGIAFINIPTTLLAQVDASVGGKLGIDFLGFKNHIGVFQEPKNVFISSKFLQTLDRRELRSGFSEVIKHCLIHDAKKFEEISKKNLEQQDWADVIRHSVEVKRQVVRKDPHEKGLRKILNFGHTLGHAIETYFMNSGNRILHGEAIAKGMICETWLSEIKCGLKHEENQKVFNYIRTIFNLKPIDPGSFESILALTIQDKKNENNIVMASILDKIGNCLFNIEVTKEEMRKSLEFYNEKVG